MSVKALNKLVDEGEPNYESSCVTNGGETRGSMFQQGWGGGGGGPAFDGLMSGAKGSLYSKVQCIMGNVTWEPAVNGQTWVKTFFTTYTSQI